MIYVDFSLRDPAGRLYVARKRQFTAGVALGDRFIGTDHDEFTVECEVLAIDHLAERIYHRPVRPWEVPGTASPYGLPAFVNCRVAA